LYDDDVVDEDTVLAWRDDMDDQTAGKPNALVQLRKWLEELDNAEEESAGDD